MNLPQEWEAVAQERLRAWEQEMSHRQLLSQLPQKPSRWRRFTGGSLVWMGSGLLRWGERMAQHECQEKVSVAGQAAG